MFTIDLDEDLKRQVLISLRTDKKCEQTIKALYAVCTVLLLCCGYLYYRTCKLDKDIDRIFHNWNESIDAIGKK